MQLRFLEALAGMLKTLGMVVIVTFCAVPE